MEAGHHILHRRRRVLLSLCGLLVAVLLATGAAAAPARAAHLDYRDLSSLGVRADRAVLEGRRLSVRIRATQTVRLRFAIVRNGGTRSWAKATVKRGTTTVIRRLNLAPLRFSNLELRVTAYRGDRRARARIALRATPYDRLHGLGVSASRAVLSGQTIRLRISSTNNARIALAVIGGGRSQAWVSTRVQRGTRTLILRLNRVPRDLRNAELRVTVYRGRLRAREFIGLRVIGAPAPPPNLPPTDIALSSATVAENLPAGTTVGTLSGTDPNPGDALSFALVAGAGDSDNASFTVSGTTLRTAAAFDFEAKAAFSIRVRVTDGAGAGFDKVFAIAVTNVNDAPVVTTTAGATANTENATSTVDAGLTVSDADDANIDGAVVRISAGFQVGDELVFVDQGAITGSYAAGTGVLTLTGSATKADYQAALRSIGYRHTGDDPGASKAVAFTVSDGSADSAPATKAIDVTPVNDPPVVGTTLAALAYTENDGAVAVDPGLTVADPDSPQLTGATVAISANFAAAQDALAFVDQLGITGSYDAGTGVLTLTGSATAAEYRTALRSVTYANGSEDPSAATRTVSFSVTDGAATSNVATRDIAITAVNDPPIVTTSAGSTAYTEGGATAPVDPTVTPSDVDDANLESAVVRLSVNRQTGDQLLFVDQAGITGSYVPATGVLTLTGSASVASYLTALRSIGFMTTNDDPAAAKTVEFKVNDGSADSNLATKQIAVTGVNDAPVVTTTAGALAYAENSGPIAADPAVGVSDPDSAQAQGATVQVTSNFVSAQDELAFADQLGITGSYDDTTGLLTLTGTTTIANYQAALRAVTYENVSNAPAPPTRTLTFTVTDAQGDTSAPAARAVTLGAANDAATITTSAGALAYTEGDPATVVDASLLVSDPDDASLEGATVQITAGLQPADELLFTDQLGITGSYNAASGLLTLSGTSALGNYQTALSSVSYRHNGDAPGSLKTVAFRADDGDGLGPASTRNIAVTPVNDGPVVTTTAGSLAYTENAGPLAIDPGLTVGDPDSTQLAGATVAISANFAPAQDDLAFTDQLGITGVYDDVTGVLTLTGNASVAAYETALRTVTYVNVSEGPAPPTRTIAFQATDDQAAAGNTATKSVAVTSVNDPPTAVNDNATTDEDTALNVSAPGVLSNDTDPDPGDTKTVVQLNGSATLTGTSVAGAAVTINANGSFTYDPGAVFQGLSTGDSDTDSFTYTMQDGAAAQSTATVNLTINGVSDAPVAGDDTLNGASAAIGNTTLVVDDPSDGPPAASGPKKSIGGDILANDSDPDSPSISVTPGTFASNDGGSVTLQSDGDFVYTPAAGTSCSDTDDFFTYTVTDGVASDTGQVDISIAGCVWYVDNADPGNAGTSSAPFDTLAQAEGASGAGDTIFVHDGDNTTTGLGAGIDLKPNQRLLGEAATLQVGADVLQAGDPAKRPTVTDSGADVVALASGNTVRGLQIDPSGAGGGIAGGAGDAGGTIDDVRIVDTGTAGTQPGIELDGTSGTFTFSDVTIDNTAAGGATGVRLNNAGTANFAPAGTISITTSGAKGLEASGTSLGAGSVFDAITVTGSSAGAVSMVNTTGTTTFANLDLTTSSGATPAFRLSNAGDVTVAGGGTANVSATGAAAIDVSATPGPTLAFDNVSVVSSGASGIILDGLGSGTFSASGGTLAGVASGVGSVAFNLNGGSGDVTYGGTIADGSGGSALVRNRTGGVVTLSGTITDGPDVNGGPAVLLNSGGSTVFSGATKTFSTGAGSGVTLLANTGHTVSFTNGGLDVDTTSGTGFSASNGGTVNVSGAGNTIDTATGNGLLIDNTTIGASHVTMQRVSTNGAAVGIRANATGTSGRLIVTGAGGTCTPADTSGCSGGEIANSTFPDSSLTTPGGTGVVLVDTLNPSLTRMWLHDHSNYAIRGTNVAGFTLANSVINGANGTNATTPFDDSSVWIDNLTGSATVSDTAISGGREDNLRVVNSAGSLNRITLSSVTIGDNHPTDGNDGVLLETESSAGQLQATVTGSTFTGAGGDLLQFSHGGSGSGDLVMTGNAFSNSHASIATGGGGLSLIQGGQAGSDTTMTINGNSFRDSVGHGVLAVNSIGPAPQTGTFTNNVIGVSGTANSGSAEGSGLKLQSVDQGTTAWTVSANTIRGYNNFGIEVLAGGLGAATPGTMNTTITGNTITQPGTTPGTITIPKQGIHYNVGTTPGDSFQVCADIRNNTISTSGADSTPSTIDVDVRMRQRQSTTIRLPGYLGGPTDTAAVQAFIAANNDAGTSVLAQVNSPPGGGYSGGAPATCP